MEKTLFQNLIHIISRYKLRVFLGTFLILISNLLLIGNPLILRVALTSTDHAPWQWALLLLTVAFVSATLRYFMRVEFSKVSREVERDMRSKVFNKIASQSRAFYDRYGVGELIERLSSDMSAYRDVLGPGLLFPVYFITTVIPGLLALYWISPFMAMLATIPVFMIPILNLIIRKPIYSAAEKVQVQLSKMGNFVQESYAGIRIVKSFAAESFLLNHFSKLCEGLFGVNFKLMTLQGGFFPLLTMVTRIITILLVLTAGLLVLSPADFVSFMWIQSYIFFPVIILGWVIPMWQQGRASYDRLHTLYYEPVEVQGGESELTIPHSTDIIFKHLNFGYPGFPESLTDINTVIKAGTFVGLTGPTGSGKSTLFKLLNREYEIPVGMIYFGEQEIHDFPLSSFWSQMVSVEQIPFLFSKSIRENVSFGNHLASEEEIYAASKLADLHETVLEFDQGYETLVGERGVMLSGGQKSRIAIARALLVNRSIILLDDIFSALDNKTALNLFEALKKHAQGKTLLIITSKVSILERLDHLIVMIKGRIHEEGTPEQLIAQKGHFYTLKELDKIDA